MNVPTGSFLCFICWGFSQRVARKITPFPLAACAPFALWFGARQQVPGRRPAVCGAPPVLRRARLLRVAGGALHPPPLRGQQETAEGEAGDPGGERRTFPEPFLAGGEGGLPIVGGPRAAKAKLRVTEKRARFCVLLFRASRRKLVENLSKTCPSRRKLPLRSVALTMLLAGGAHGAVEGENTHGI